MSSSPATETESVIARSITRCRYTAPTRKGITCGLVWWSPNTATRPNVPFGTGGDTPKVVPEHPAKLFLDLFPQFRRVARSFHRLHGLPEQKLNRICFAASELLRDRCVGLYHFLHYLFYIYITGLHISALSSDSFGVTTLFRECSKNIFRSSRR